MHLTPILRHAESQRNISCVAQVESGYPLPTLAVFRAHLLSAEWKSNHMKLNLIVHTTMLNSSHIFDKSGYAQCPCCPKSTRLLISTLTIG